VQSFTKLPNDRFSNSAAFQFYALPIDITFFLRYLRDVVCFGTDSICVRRIGDLGFAALIDISYDTVSHALKFTVQWPHQLNILHAKAPPFGEHRTEVGLLTQDTPPTLGKHEIGLQGVLTVLGEHKKPSATLFSFPSRHRQHGATFSASFLQPTGLHPMLQLNISSSTPPEVRSSCALHAYFTLPKTLFPDKYQLADKLFLSSKKLKALRYVSDPVDLEAPAYKTQVWGSSVLLELAPPSSKQTQAWTALVPLHSRYLPPTETGYVDIEAPYPVLFWACSAEEGTKFPNNPFDRANLGYDALFGPRTIFWHMEPHPSSGKTLMTKAKIPVIDEKYSSWIGTGTGLIVLIGCGWVLWALISAFRRSRSSESETAKKFV
jgi:PIG-X / PBN1